MIGIIGKKLGMTQVFNDQGQQIPVTVVEAPPNPVVKVTDKAVAGFAAVELGYGQQRTARESKKGEGKPRGRRANSAEIATRRRRVSTMRRACFVRFVWTTRLARTRRSRPTTSVTW